MAHILLAGATSRLGRALLPLLDEAGHTVRLLLRDPARSPVPHLDVARGDLLNARTLPAACEGIDVVISLVGAPVSQLATPRNVNFDTVDHLGTAELACAASDAGVQRMVYLSVHGDYPDHIGYVTAHRRAEDAIAATPMRPAVVRATGFQGTLTVLVNLARAGVLSLPGGGEVRSNPIAESDLAQVVAQAVDHEDECVDVGGPEILTRRRMAEIAFEALHKPPRIVPVPTWSLRTTARMTRPVSPRLADLAEFFAWIHDHDAVAPQVGTRTLQQTFRDHVAVLHK
ncbi:MAG: NAD(P)H-binding protein [Myxococcales bacterium]|nr:NAD(P)H-binding protein [Myxococcales bacterium]